MLSDEEKQAINNLKLNVTNVGFSVYDGATSLFKMRDIQIVLNLIDKKSKEIEELKEENEKYKNPPFFDEDNYVEKDKIKAKIEEYKHKDFIKMQVVWKHDKEALKIAEVLQSLLEKE